MKNKLRTANGQFTGDFTQLALYTRELEDKLRTMEAKLQAADELAHYLEEYEGRQNHDEWCSVVHALRQYRNAGGE